VCCDLVVINQSVSGIPRFIKDRIETTFVMSRLVALGFKKRYRVNVYVGVKCNKQGLVAQYQNKFNDEIFKLYKSFDGVNGKQTVIDDRQNFFKSGTFRLMMIFIILAFGYSYYSLKDFISPKKQDGEQVQEVEEVKERENKEDVKPNNTAINKVNESTNNDDFVDETLFPRRKWSVIGIR